MAERHGRSVLHGYSLDDLDELARRVVRNNLAWWPAGDRADQYDTAWMGIAEYLCSAESAPSARELLEAGVLALHREVRGQIRHRGARRDGTNTGAAFDRYWSWCSAPLASPEAAVTERLALAQIWPALTARQRDCLTALAATGDYLGSASALGIMPQTYRSLIGRARREFLKLWHEGEIPSRPWRQDRRVRVHETADPAELASRALYAGQQRARRREAKAA